MTAETSPHMAHQTDSFHLFGVLVRFLARHAETQSYCLCEVTCAPGAGAPPNRHPGETEAFYVLDGAFDFTIDGTAARVGAGDFVRIPDGAMHAFRNAGAAPARLLVLNAPGAMHDIFFSEAGEPMPRGARALPASPGAPDFARVFAAAAKSGMELAPPPA